MSEWASVPEQHKDSVLHTQQVEKWRDSLYEMYLHFNQGKFEGYPLLARRDFDARLRATLQKRRHSKRASPSSLSAYAEVCGVHKSTISRYLKAYGFVIDGKHFSQNEILRSKRYRAMTRLFEACRDNGGDFAKLGPIISLLDGQKSILGITSMFETPTSSYGVVLGYWMGDQPEEVQDRVYRDLGKDPAKEHAFIHNLTKAFLEGLEVDATP